MKKILTLIITLFFGALLWAQDDEAPLADSKAYSFYPPNYEKIQQESLNPKSKHYFPTLAKRFSQADTTLELDDLIAFYYGYIFQPGYNPYKHYDQLLDIRNIMSAPSAGKKECQQIIKLADQVISTNPTEPVSYNYKFMAQSMLCQDYNGDTIEREKTRMQFLQLYYTMMATGNGLSPQEAIHVNNTSHEYMIMQLNGFSPRSQSLKFIDGHAYDAMALDSNEYGIDTLYFNIDKIMAANFMMFSSKPSASVASKKKVTTLDIPFGNKVVLELVKTKRKNSTFRVLSMVPITDTLDSDDPTLFPDTIPHNQIILYFGHARLLDKVTTNLIFKGNTDVKTLQFDTEISQNNSFHPTSNRGIFSGVLMNEIWKDNIEAIRISNIRRQ